MKRTPLGWLQLKKEKSRLLVAIAGISFADILIFMQLGFQGALYDSNTRFIRSINADIILVSPTVRNSQTLSTFTRRRLYQSMDVEGVVSAYPLYSQTLSWNNPQTNQKAFVQVIGFDPNHEALNLPELNSQLDVLKIPRAVIFDRGSRGDYGEVIAKVEGGEVVSTEADGSTVEIRGLFKLGSSFGSDGFLATSSQNFGLIFPRRSPGSVSLGLVKVDTGVSPETVTRRLQQHLPNDVAVFTMEQFINKEKAYWTTQSPIGFVFGLGTVMAFVVGVVIVYQVLSTDVNAHLREYATFKAMGYRHRFLLGIVFEEAVILAILGFFPSIFVASGLYRLATKATSLPLLLSLSRIILVFGLTIIMCILSGAIATRKLQQADPADMF
jgi:putative ABC transport system permease protein